jgi:penicillin-insensitive murein endopeptidase
VLGAHTILALTIAFGDPASFCDERPSAGASASRGSHSTGSLDGGAQLRETDTARVLTRRHRARCLAWGTERLVRALESAGARVAQEHPGSPALGVGNIGRPRGGPIRAYSRSHHAGRDADLAFYFVDDAGAPVAVDDLVRVDALLRGTTADGKPVRLDVARTWTLVATLLEDDTIDVRWLFVSIAIKDALLTHAVSVHTPKRTLARAREALHQPSDAPPHDDHVHVRIRCTAAEAARGCS